MIRYSTLLLALTLALTTARGQRAFLQAEGVPGCSYIDRHEDEHDVYAYDHGMYRTVDSAGRPGQVVPTFFSFVTDLGCSVAWRERFLENTIINYATLTLERVTPGGPVEPFFRIAFRDLMVVSIEEVGSDRRLPEFEPFPHQERIGLTYREACWADIATGIEHCQAQGGPLSVNLVFLRVVPDGPDIHVKWAAVSTPDVTAYEVMHRRPDAGGPFRGVATVMVGSDHGVAQYDARITGLQPGRHAFRIAEMRTDGSVDYSDVMEVDIGVQNGTFVLAGPFPNPVRTSASLRLAVDRDQVVEISLFDVTGRRVHIAYRGFVGRDAVHTIRLDLPEELASGAYVAMISGPAVKAERLLTLVR